MKVDNDQLRKQLKAQRSQLSTRQQDLLSAKIADRLSKTPDYLAAKNIALYIPVNGEADPRYLVAENKDPSRKFYLPVLSPTGNKHLNFTQWDKDTQFTNNIFGIPEPNLPHNSLASTQLDLVIMPLVGFDAQGNRLGMGGGYYDRTFAFRLKNKDIKTPLLIAYAYTFQQCKKLSAQSWDVPIDAYVTENKFANI